CDEAQPVCQRCAKSRRICDGRQAFIVHTENPYASGQKKRPRGPRSTRKSEPATTLHALLPRQPLDLQAEAVVYYVRFYLHSPKDALPLLSAHCAPSDLQPGRTLQIECQLVNLAISSIALALFSRTQQCPQAGVQAAAQYQKLLQLLQLTLISLNQNNIESCLLAISHMGLYENAIYRPQKQGNASLSMALPSMPHDEGALVLLKFWKEHLSLRQPATNVVKTIRREAIKHALLGKVALPEWMKDGAAFGEDGLALEYDTILIRIASVRQRLSALFQYKSSRQPDAKELAGLAEPLNQEAQDIDQALQDWRMNFPNAWSYTRHRLPTHRLWPKTSFFSPEVSVYRRLEDAAVWARYFSSRMLVLSTRLSILQNIEVNPDSLQHEQSSGCRFKLQATAASLASTVPFCLERFKFANGPDLADQDITLNKSEITTNPYAAGLVTNPLVTASSIVSHLPKEQKSWFQSQLAQLGRVSGFGIFEIATTERWSDL
ncbi:hypothetical protein BU16DRAFT_422248, partial [Lophium mytilinum]